MLSDGLVREDQVASAAELDWVNGDASDMELLREGMESGCR